MIAVAAHLRRIHPLHFAAAASLGVLLLCSALSAQEDFRITELERRVTAVESLSVDRRLGVLESDMFEVKLLCRSACAALVGQITLAVVGYRRNR